MNGEKVAAVRTKVETALVMRAFVVGFWRLWQVAPTRAFIDLVTAQWAHETGRGRSMMCFNVGNIKATAAWPELWTEFSTHEILPEAKAQEMLAKASQRTDGLEGLDVELGGFMGRDRVVKLHPSHPGSRFRAFTTLEDGATDHLSAVYERFPKAWGELLIGDPVRYPKALKANGYFTDDLAKVTASFVSMTREFSRLPVDLSYPEREGIDVAAATAASFASLAAWSWEGLAADRAEKGRG